MITTAESNKPLVVVSYVKKDTEWLEAFRPHLDVLGQYGHVDIWDETDIAAGSDRFRELDEHMKSARIVICLISADYLSAIRSFEAFDYLLEQRQRGGLVLLPILVKACPWQLAPWLKRIQMFPRDNQPVSSHYRGREDEVFADVVMDVYDRCQAFEPVEATSKTKMQVAEAARQIMAEDAVVVPPPEVELPDGLREDIQHLPETGHKLFGRTRELAVLDAAWASGETNVISLIAWGGVGKSTLVNRWLERMRADGYRGARRVFAWSFYSQGTKEQVTSSDLFFDESLRWFGAEGFEKQSIWDKAELLAGLIREEPTLLVLDGVEPLQSGDDFDRGVFRDGGLQCLLQELIRDNSGLCVVTSRVPLTDYEDDMTIVATESLPIKDDGTVDGYPKQAAVQVDLETISPEAGRDLLKTEFVQGTNAELEQATRDFGCHALAVSLLGSWLHEVPGHNISQRDQIPDLDLPEEEGKHARRVLAAFEDMLGESAELELLRIMGLFDRPASTDLVEAVLEGKTIDGLTSHYGKDFRATLTSSLAKLRHLRLLASVSEHRPDDIDCHPLVREHFATQLDERLPDAAREAHRRLYEHLKQAAPNLPDNLDDMMPLFHAVAHGCMAELWPESYNSVLLERLQQGDKGSKRYSTAQLGAFGLELATLAGFFSRKWDKIVPQLDATSQDWILNLVGFALGSLGRLKEGSEALNAGLESAVKEKRWAAAAKNAGNLSDSLLIMGEVGESIRSSELGIELSDHDSSERENHQNSSEPGRHHNLQTVTKRTKLGDALHQAGKPAESRRAFLDAERLQAEWWLKAEKLKKSQRVCHDAEEPQKQPIPYSPRLYSIAGARYADLTLADAEQWASSTVVTKRKSIFIPTAIEDCLRVLEHTEDAKRANEGWYSLRAIGLDHVTIGRTFLIEAVLKSAQDAEDTRTSLGKAWNELKKGVGLLRRSEHQQDIARSLLYLAALRRVNYQIIKDKSQIGLAERDLVEAERIAVRSSMLIWRIEAALERTRLAFVLGDKKQAKEKLDEACELIRQTEKPYVPHKPDWADWDPPDYIGVFKEGEIVGYHRRNREIDALRQAIDQ